MQSAPLTLGIEEEYQVVDRATGALSATVQQMMEKGKASLGDQLKPEFMQSQIEVGSQICRNIQEAKTELVRLRRAVSDLAHDHDCEIAAASTHPFSRWDEQKVTDDHRYKDLETGMQEVGRRLLIFGMHVHVGFHKDVAGMELMIDVQNQLRYFLPHLLLLTTSSPFWHGRDTGLKSYRSIVFENLPRTGIPPVFGSFQEYQQFIDIFGKIGALGKARPSGKADYTKLWWDARPQEDFGTLEVRVCDICTTVDEALCVAALVQAIVAKLIKLRNQNQSWRIYRTELIAENKWRAARYGLDGHLVDYGKMEAVPARFLVGELIEFVDDVLDELGSRREVEYAHKIVQEGSSADRQKHVFTRAIDQGADMKEATQAVVKFLVKETMRGVR